ncbi:MAG: hypothetical protein ACO295_03595 [Sediminibacterium sp.]
MANTKTIAFSLKVDGVDKTIKSIDELDKSIVQLEETLKSAEFGTQAFKDVEQQLIKARSAKEDLDKSLEGRGAEKRLQGIVGLAEGVGGAFAVASQASLLFGKESENLAKVEAKAQQALAVVMGIRAIKEGLLNSALERKIILEKAAAAGTVILNGINKALNITLSLNPIGLIVTALGLLVVGIMAAIGPIKKFIAQFDFLGDGIQWVIDKARDLASWLSFGLIDDSATAKTRDNSEAVIAALDDAGSAANRNIAAQKRRLDLMSAQGATEEQLLEQKKRINKEEVASRQKAIDALLKLQAIDGELDEDKKKKLVELQEQIKDLNNQALIDQANYDKKKADDAKNAAKEQADKAKANAKAAADKAKAEADKAIEMRKSALDRIKKLEDEYYLDGIKDENKRAQEALRIQQEEADKAIQIQIDALDKKKKLTAEETALREALVLEQEALDKRQAQQTNDLIESQNKALLEKQKAYNDELMALKNELLLSSIANAEERSMKELEIQLAQQVEEINARQISEEQKAALIEAVTANNAAKVAELQQAQIQQTEEFRVAMMEEGLAKQYALIDLETEAKIAQLETLKLSEQEYADAVIKINQDAAKIKDQISRAQLLAQLDATASVLGSVGALFGENTIAFKATKIAETGISTFSSATKAFESMVGIPVVGPVLAPIAAGAAIAAGLINIGKIAGIGVKKDGGGDKGGSKPQIQPSKFASGGFVTGPGTGTSDSIPAMLSAGESVINARSTEMFGSLLNQINQAGGGAEIPNNGSAPVIKTYVVASDMSSQQEADKRINDIARI